MERLLLVANPSASAFTGAALRRVTDALGASFDVHQEWPDDGKGTREAAAAAAASGYAVVAAMGGDGVLHHAANGLVGSETALAVIPAGTTNVLARILGIPHRAHKAAKELAGYRRTEIPLAEVAFDGGASGSRIAVFAVGMGFDGAVMARAEKTPWSKLHFGSIHYARSTFAELLRHRRRSATIRAMAGNRSADAVAVSVQVQSRYTYFGPLSFGFGRDAGLAVMIAERLPASRFLAAMVRLAAERPPAASSPFQVWRGVRLLELAAEPTTELQVDGEPIGLVDHVAVRASAQTLTVCAPRPD